MSVIRYWSPFGFLALAPLGFWIGGIGAFVVVAAAPLTLLLLDPILGEDSPRGVPNGFARYRLLPWLYIPLQLAEIGWAAAMAARPSTTLLECVGLALSTALTAGVFGFLAAHEMVHSRSRRERGLGLIMLAGVLYMPFAISHLLGHHRRAATYGDPASARRGESAYAFLFRSIAGQMREAWTFEAGRLSRAGRRPIGFGNRMLAFLAIELGTVVAIGCLSLRALGFFLTQAALAIVLLELFNYIAHYGLTRRLDADGRLEPFGPQHSWNSPRRMNNAALLNMGRHSDHHRFSSRPYQRLELTPGAAELPGGYAAAILLALIPPLWRRIMDPRVDAVMASAPLAAEGRRPPLRPAPRLTPRLRLLSFEADPRGRDRVVALGAEGATAPETLRQKDREVG